MITVKNINGLIEEKIRDAAEGVDTIAGYAWQMSQDVRDLIPKPAIENEKLYSLPIAIVEGKQILTLEPK